MAMFTMLPVRSRNPNSPENARKITNSADGRMYRDGDRKDGPLITNYRHADAGEKLVMVE